MDMHRSVRRHRRDGIELVRRCCAQAMRRDTDNGLLKRTNSLASFLKQTSETFDIVDESPLAIVGSGATEGRMSVKNRQQRQADAGVDRGSRDAPGHLGEVGVRLP